MDWSGSAACRLCHGLLREIGRTLPCLPASERGRQSSFGRKHDFLRVVSIDICEPHLGSHSGFRHCHEKASFLSLVTDSKTADFCICARSISNTFPIRSENRPGESLA